MELLTKEKVREILKSNKPLATKRKAFLAETIAYYAIDPENRRAVGGDGECLYRVDNEADSLACAVGRWIPYKYYDPGIEEFTVFALARTEGTINGLKVPECSLLQEAKVVDPDFLVRVQHLHDSPSNWGDPGLSPEGVESVKKILSYIKLTSTSTSTSKETHGTIN